MSWRRWLTPGAVVLVLGGCLWGLASHQQRKAKREAEDWLEIFRPKTQHLVPDEARALADLAKQDYSARWSLLSWRWREGPWVTHSYVIDPTFLITQWRLKETRWLGRDLNRLVFMQGLKHFNLKLSLYSLLEIDLEPDPKTALLKMSVVDTLNTWPVNSVYWRDHWRLERFQAIAYRMPARRTEIENDYVWPILLAQYKQGRLPNFVDYLSPETRRPRASFIANALVSATSDETEHADVAQQALLLDGLIGNGAVGRITETLLARELIATEPSWSRRRLRGFLARLVNRYEPDLAVWETRRSIRLLQADSFHLDSSGKRTIWDRRDELKSFVEELRGEHREAACAVVLEAWLTTSPEGDWASLESVVELCVETWDNDELEAALAVAVQVYEDQGYRWEFTQTAGPMLVRLGSHAPPGVLSIFRRSLRTRTDNQLARLRRTARAIAKQQPRSDGHQLAAEVALLLADEPLTESFDVKIITDVLQNLCGVMEGTPRNELAEALHRRLSEDNIDYRVYPRAACLAALRPSSQPLFDLQAVLLAALDNAQDEWTRNWAVLALVTLAQDDENAARRAAALKTALANTRNLPHPRCDLLTRLVPQGDLSTFARILRLPTCSSYERRLMVGQLAERHGLPIEAFARPFVNVSLDIGYKVDPVRVALWLDERGL